MKIIRIFDNCLFSIKYDEESKDEFERLLDLWNDIEYLEDFFENNITDLHNGFWGEITIEEAILTTQNDAAYIERRMLELSKQSLTNQTKGLESLFVPLDDCQTNVLELNKSKTRKSWIRIYALRVGNNSYIITGGAIKLTAKMEEREHTQKELYKLDRVRNYYLREKGISDIDGIIEELEI